MRIPAPIGGLQEGRPAVDQEAGTFFSGQNIRAFDIKDERLRVGQRPGTELAYDTQIIGGFPIIHLTSIVTTYIEPEA